MHSFASDQNWRSNMLVLIALLQASGMIFTEARDSMTDRLTLTAEARSGDSRLVVRCVAGGKLKVTFTTADHYLQRVRATAVWQARVDSKPPRDIVWYIDDPHTAQLDKRRQSKSFADSLLGGTSLRMRVNMDAPFDLVFDISGSSQALSRVASACK
jgi:hypothetical protein